MEVLRTAGKRIPEDVAVIGFDDILEARSQIPPLTTVRHPTFTLGHQALLSLLRMIRDGKTDDAGIRVPTQLVIRQSCGCRTETAPMPSFDSPLPPELDDRKTALAQRMADAMFLETRHSRREEIERLCTDIVQAFTASLSLPNQEKFDVELARLSDWLETRGEDASPWHAAFSTVRRGLPGLLAMIPGAEIHQADALIDGARIAVAELAQRQAADELVKHKLTSNRLGLMTSQLQAALNGADIAGILAEHLPVLGIRRALAAQYLPREDDPVACSRILLDVGPSAGKLHQEFATREFPPPGLYSSETPFALGIFPLVIDERITGFAALSAANLEPCAAIVHNLASALRTGQLYQDALTGRHMAEEANRLKSRFLSMVSHELRTPLSLIVGLSEMVLREKPKGSEAAARDLEQIHTSAQHLARLIGDVLDLASTEAGQLRILHEPLDLAEVLQVAANIGEQLARDKGLEWKAQLPPRGTPVIGDRTRLRQVTLNLISNAVKFTAEGRVALHVSVDGTRARISVSDTGVGISAGELEAVFKEFYRSERTVQSGYGGLGLGLAISKHLVEQHGGSIGVRSPGDLGCGSTFFFTLPIAAEAASPPELVSALGAGENTVAVLTARADSAELLCLFLRRRGFAPVVHCVDDETDWLPKVISAPPTALILGGRLAARDGLALVGLFKRQPATEHVPVLAFSLDPEKDQGELLELNYLQKPLRPEQLSEELAQYCRPQDGPHTVLVVDDDPAILDLHSRLVRQIGCQATTARNGREALESVQRARPDLILLDLMMPEMDGFAVLDALQSREALRSIPVIILTAHVLSESDLERCNRGVAAILSKGLFSAAETLDHIESVLARQHTLGRATQQLVRLATACIHSRYAEAITREDIARQVGISADYLTDCFRQELGITPMTYLRRFRIHRARELLETTDQSIMQIALQTGFSDGAYFTRTFQREVGMTPRAYRRKGRG